MEESGPSEISVSGHKTTQFKNSEDHNHNNHLYELHPVVYSTVMSNSHNYNDHRHENLKINAPLSFRPQNFVH
jgi:hypothetical protein